MGKFVCLVILRERSSFIHQGSPRLFIIMQSHNSRHFYANAIGIVHVKSSVRSMERSATTLSCPSDVLIDFVGNL